VKPRKSCIFIFALVAFTFLARTAYAGGSGLNVFVVINQNSTNSVQLANYFCEKRQVPPLNVFRMTNWAGGNIEWQRTNFEADLMNPVIAAIASRGLTNQIDYVVLSMDIPYRVMETNDFNSTTSALFYGFKRSLCPLCSFPGCTLPANAFNAYFASEGIFRFTPPVNVNSNSYLVTMITASNLWQAKRIVDQGVASDSTFPTNAAVFGKSSDRLRNIRYWLFDDAMFNIRLRNVSNALRTNADNPTGLGLMLGYLNGAQFYNTSSNMFVPGAMADNLTSYSGTILEISGQTTVLPFLLSGASGGYGTVDEPCAYIEKFPSGQNYFYQARGFSLAESYYMSIEGPLHGVVYGEPLAAPFAVPATGGWNNLAYNATLSGTTNLSLQFTAPDISRPICRVDLFLDEKYLQTITNITPTNNNTVSVTVNGFTASYTVPLNASIKSVASNVMVKLNGITNSSKAIASVFGDRVELVSQDITKFGTQMGLSASSSIGTAPVLTTFTTTSGTNLLDSLAYPIRSYVLTNDPAVNDYLRLTVLLTNGTTVVTSVTNTFSATNLLQLANVLITNVNTNVALQGPDGVVIEDVNMHEEEPYRSFIYGTSDHSGEFNIRARSQGWPASQVKVCVSGSPTFIVWPPGTNRVDENISDLQPRGHVYLSGGRTNLSFNFGLNTTTLADGYHDLTAVAYEGTHVRTEKRATQTVRIHNTILSATFVSLLGDTNTAIEATMQFAVTANTNSSAVSKIELYGTGGLLATVSGQSNVVFSIAGTNLDLGLHAFYAIVTLNNGQPYRTETKWIRLVGATPSFSLMVTNPPPTFAWPALAGRAYEVLSATNITDTFQSRGFITPTNSLGIWMETNAAPHEFYKIRASQ